MALRFTYSVVGLARLLWNGVAAVSGLRDVTEAGGLLSYANDIRDTFRRVAYFIDRLLCLLFGRQLCAAR